MNLEAQDRSGAPCEKILVVELGDRLAVANCGSLLAQLGATVVLIEPKQGSPKPSTKWDQRPLAAAGKRSFVVDLTNAADRSLLETLLARCDVVLTSSDMDSPQVQVIASEHSAACIRCDITAFGGSGPLAGRAYSDIELQAIAGIIDTTGAPDGRPVATQLPIVELFTGIWSAAAVVAALRMRRKEGVWQSINMAMYDCAVTTLATFFPKHFAGMPVERIGNHHPSLSPWNAYRTKDGWIQICTGSTEHWLRAAEIIGYPNAAQDKRFATSPSRLHWSDELDRLIETWTKTVTAHEAFTRLSAAGIPCGPICTIEEMLREPNLAYRNMVLNLSDASSRKSVRIPGALFRGTRSLGRSPTSIPARDEARCAIQSFAIEPRQASSQAASQANSASLSAPLAGIRVIEIGQWTTAPLAARQLAALGADVVKIEPPGGDGARNSAPHAEGESYLFNLNNSDKRCIEIDMRTEEGRSTFKKLIPKAHVLVENLKPGSLARFGFSPEELEKLNPQLVYCAISGFGAYSLYPGRPAMDTVLQAMCGTMDLTRAQEMPYKIGISVSDLMGGYFGLLGILAALESCAQSGKGQFIDLSMQDITAWSTQLAWNGRSCDTLHSTFLKCKDGYVLAAAEPVESSDNVSAMSRVDCIEWLRTRGVKGVPVLSVGEVAAAPQTAARKLIRSGKRTGGRAWPLLASPIRFEKTATIVRQPPQNLGIGHDAILQIWPSA